jgi:hypothetical protein
MKTAVLVKHSLALVLLAVAAAGAQAQTITNLALVDPGFESPALANGTSESLALYPQNGVPYISSGIYSVYVDNPTVTEFPGLPNASGDNILLGPAGGTQALELATTQAAGTASTAQAQYDTDVDPIGKYVAGDTYTLTVAIGDGLGDTSGGTYSLDLKSGVAIVDTVSAKAGLQGTFSTLSLSYVATAAMAGTQIGFNLDLATVAAHTITDGFVDNVTLTQTAPAPEPSSMALMAAGMAAVASMSYLRKRLQA